MNPARPTKCFYWTQVLFACVLLFWYSHTAAEVYRWVDSDGNVHYSDNPKDGAEKVELGETSVVPALKPQSRSGNRRSERVSSGAAGYESIAIASPAHETTLRNVQGIAVSIALAPGLRAEEGHLVQLYYDGAAYGEPQSNLQFQIAEAERGAHELVAAVVDASGTELLRSSPSTFYLHQRSVQHPPPSGAPPAVAR